MSVLVVGSIALDTVETPFGNRQDSFGGSALYFSCAASFFIPVNVVGVVGTDFDFSRIGFLKDRKVDLSGLKVEEGETFRWGGRYFPGKDKRETLFTYLNVFENFRPRIPEKYQKSGFVFLANIDPELQLQVLQQIRKPQLVVLDTMNFWISGKKDVLTEVVKKSDVIILNDEEIREFAEESNLLMAGRKILDLGPQYLIIKKGEHGAVLMSDGNYFSAPAYPLEKVVDPTGAGDSFAGGFLGYLAQNKKVTDLQMRKAIIYGSTVASFNVEDFSFDRLKKITRDELNDRFNNFMKIVKYW